MAKIGRDIPKLPDLLTAKIYKTGQTRGADDDVIFQNRVGRNSTVIIPYPMFGRCRNAPDNEGIYENGYIVLIKPDDYFGKANIATELAAQGLTLGNNLLIFYETREQWIRHNPHERHLTHATSRINPLNGSFVARVPATTAADGGKISLGFTTSGMKGAGIRVYEYASPETIRQTRIQLEFIFWCCHDANEVLIEQGMSNEQIEKRRAYIVTLAHELGLDNNAVFRENRILNDDDLAVCPLCLKPLSAGGFFDKLEQAQGRDVPDLTVTKINLFHIVELRTGEFNHRPYNLGWGHHHCNMVTKDSGIVETLKWMDEIIQTNKKKGYKF